MAAVDAAADAAEPDLRKLGLREAHGRKVAGRRSPEFLAALGFEESKPTSQKSAAADAGQSVYR
jgi:hypothetical protein